jgi:hypothetical protein
MTFSRVFDPFTVDLVYIARDTTCIAPQDLENAADPPKMDVSREHVG